MGEQAKVTQQTERWNVGKLGQWDNGQVNNGQAVCKDFATEVVMIWQIMVWEQAQAGDRAGKTRRRLQR